MTATGTSLRRQVAPTSVLLVAAFGAFLAFLDSTIVNVAFPSIQAAFPHSSFDYLSWVLNAYNIVFAAFLVAAGRIADLLGRRRTFLTGIAVFTLASAGCAAAGSVDVLIAFRVLQALGAAVLVPASLALVVEAFPAEHRAHGIGLWGASGALAAGLGPPIGGALVVASNWRLAFVVNIPLGIAGYMLARRTLVESRAPGVRTMPDLRGAGLLALSLATLTLGIVKGQDWGWASAGELISLGIAVGSFIGLVQSSRRHRSPILDFELLRIRPFVVANAVTLVASMGFYAYLLTHILWLHYVWQYSLLKAGLAVAPGALVAAVVAGVLGRVADEKGYRAIAVPGALIWAAGFGWYILVVGTRPNFLFEWLPGQLISGVGVGATLPILASAALKAVPGGRYAGASAVVTSSRQVGAVLGIALLVVIIGAPKATSAAARVFRHGWEFSAICFLVAAIGAWLLKEAPSPAAQTPRATEPAPRRLAARPSPVAATRTPTAGPEHAEVPAVLDRPMRAVLDGPLSDVALFADISHDMRAVIQQQARTVSLLAGEWLFKAGDHADSMYVLRTGQVEVVIDGAVVAELGRGAVVGELGILTGAPRSGSIRARRDSQLLQITREQFDELSAAEPAFLRSISATVAGWMQTSRPERHKGTRSAVIAVIGLDDEAPASVIAAELVAGLSRRELVHAPHRILPSELEAAEATHDRVVLCANGTDGAEWLSFCYRQADRIVAVSSKPHAPTQFREGRDDRDVDLVLTGERASRADVIGWYDVMSPCSLHRVDPDAPRLAAQLRSLVARLAGRSIGLVLGGGGARALAHIGVLEELELRGFYVDRVAGTSFGAIIAAFYATGLSVAEIDAACYETLVRHNPLSDWTLPTKSFVRGRKVQIAVENLFGDQYIEELPREFRCVSVDLLARTPIVHRRGRLSDAVGASIRLPGLFPPLILDNRLHVDGGVMDNLPVEALTERDEGPIIAVNIGTGGSGETRDKVRIPALGDTLIRSMMLVSGSAAVSAVQKAKVVIVPDTRGVGLLEFHQLDQMRAAGREAAHAALSGLDSVLQPVSTGSARPAGRRPQPF